MFCANLHCIILTFNISPFCSVIHLTRCVLFFYKFCLIRFFSPPRFYLQYFPFIFFPFTRSVAANLPDFLIISSASLIFSIILFGCYLDDLKASNLPLYIVSVSRFSILIRLRISSIFASYLRIYLFFNGLFYALLLKSAPV